MRQHLSALTAIFLQGAISMVFIENKYTSTYYAIINRARNTTYQGYTERHHIVPVSLGGTNDAANLVILSAREHYVCHKLLTKMVLGQAKFKMLEAFSYFSNNTNRKLKFNSRQSEELRRANSIASAHRNKGNQYYIHRKPADTELKQLRSINATKSKWVNNGTEEKFTTSHYDLVQKSNFTYGRLPEIKQKLSGPRGPLKCVRVIAKLYCPYCLKQIDPGNFSRWHGEKCSKKGTSCP